jgi:zinc transport system substrate-binding protein
MFIKPKLHAAFVTMAILGVFLGPSTMFREANAKPLRTIVASDTILCGMLSSLLPPGRYSTEAILPPGQCPGHYDVKLSDIERVKKADLIVSFKGLPFMAKAESGKREQLLVDAGGRNWMAPDAYIHGLAALAQELSQRYPEDHEEIMKRKEESIRRVETEANGLVERIRTSGIHGKAVIASSMQKEPLEWMGFRVVGEYGRPEAMSTRELVRLSRIGRDEQAAAVVDNLQSGPEAGKGIAETLGVPHVVLTNFPSEKGYLPTLSENVEAVIYAITKR